MNKGENTDYKVISCSVLYELLKLK